MCEGDLKTTQSKFQHGGSTILTLCDIFQDERLIGFASISRIQLAGGGRHGVLHPRQRRSVQAGAQGVVPGRNNRCPHRTHHPRLRDQVSDFNVVITTLGSALGHKQTVEQLKMFPNKQ